MCGGGEYLSIIVDIIMGGETSCSREEGGGTPSEEIRTPNPNPNPKPLIQASLGFGVWSFGVSLDLSQLTTQQTEQSLLFPVTHKVKFTTLHLPRGNERMLGVMPGD